jgi:hypothetical protein
MTEAETIANAVNEMLRQMAVNRDRIAQLEAALHAIAANTCCGKCQEAALVARAALGEKKDG